jgi:F-type H+-transporting ATPase subunit b
MKTSNQIKIKSKKFFMEFSLSFVISILLLFVAAVAFAGEGGEEHQSVVKAYLWPVVNFLILVVLLVYMMKKMDVKAYFKKRTELIEQSLKEAREAKELAQKALAEVEERLKVKDKEIAEIIASAGLSGEKEKARLIEEGDKLQEKILAQARTNIDYEVKKAKESIKEEAVGLAMELAEKKLRDTMKKEEQLKLLEESVAKIEGKN